MKNQKKEKKNMKTLNEKKNNKTKKRQWEIRMRESRTQAKQLIKA